MWLDAGDQNQGKFRDESEFSFWIEAKPMRCHDEWARRADIGGIMASSEEKV